MISLTSLIAIHISQQKKHEHALREPSALGESKFAFVDSNHREGESVQSKLLTTSDRPPLPYPPSCTHPSGTLWKLSLLAREETRLRLFLLGPEPCG